MKVIGFLSRHHGLDVLNALVKSEKYQLTHVYTHALNPRSQDPARSTRSDYPSFVNICKKYGVPLTTIDSKDQKIENFPECEFIIEVSWRYLIPKEITSRARIASFGIHRGKLPDYAGAEPIKQALKQNDREIIITAHYLDNVIDRGSAITTISHPVNYNPQHDLEHNIQRLREEITPLFSKIAFDALEILEKKTNP